VTATSTAHVMHASRPTIRRYGTPASEQGAAWRASSKTRTVPRNASRPQGELLTAANLTRRRTKAVIVLVDVHSLSLILRSQTRPRPSTSLTCALRVPGHGVLIGLIIAWDDARRMRR